MTRQSVQRTLRAGIQVAAVATAFIVASTVGAYAQARPNAYVFGSDAGLVLNFIKPDKTADFEAIVGKLKEALAKTDKPERKAQAAGWKVFRAAEPGAGGSVLYVFVINPAVKGADYTVSTILSEAFHDEVYDLYKKYSGAYASGQNIVNLTLLSELGQRLD